MSVRLLSVAGLHQAGRPSDANKKAVWAARSYLIEAPLTVPQGASGADNEVVHA